MTAAPDDPTRWTLIQRAAAGSDADRDEFARAYTPVVRAYLGARWKSTPLADQVDDAAQQVLLDCFKEHGALERADPGGDAGFRGFLYGVVRNVARGMERAHARSAGERGDSARLDELHANDDSLAEVFDRAWASALLRKAAALQLERAKAKGEDALQRHRLLELRYGDDLPVRDIARRWNVDPDWLHGQARQAREEFRRALEDVVRDLQGGAPESIEAQCARLLQHFS